LKSTFNDNKIETNFNNNTIKSANIPDVNDIGFNTYQTESQDQNINSTIPNFIIDDTLDTSKLENINDNLNTSFENIEDISEIINNKDIDFTIDDENISKEIANYKESQTGKDINIFILLFLFIIKKYIIHHIQVFLLNKHYIYV